jgi:hypothetical protein
MYIRVPKTIKKSENQVESQKCWSRAIGPYLSVQKLLVCKIWLQIQIPLPKTGFSNDPLKNP